MSKSIHSKAYVEFTRKLRQARLESGLTQVQVAKKLKRSQSFVSKAESGEQRIDIVEVEIFADFYNKEITFFTSKRMK